MAPVSDWRRWITSSIGNGAMHQQFFAPLEQIALRHDVGLGSTDPGLARRDFLRTWQLFDPR